MSYRMLKDNTRRYVETLDFALNNETNDQALGAQALGTSV